MSTPVKAYRYARFSHSAQATGMSLERQADAAQAWAQQHGVPLDDTHAAYVDEGVSASRGKNLVKGAMMRFRQAVAAGDVPAGSYLLVESVSRFSRLSPLDSQPILRELVEGGVRVVFFDPAIEVTAANQHDMAVGMLFQIMAYIAAEYARTLGTYKSKSWVKARDDMRNGKTATKMLPFWLTCPTTVENGKTHRGAIEPHPVYAPIVERIFREYIAGRGMPEIAARLEQGGVPCPVRVGSKDTAAKFWRHTIVGRVLANPAVYGTFQPHKEIKTAITLKSGIAAALKRKRTREGEPIAGYYPAVISRDLFEQAAQVRESNRAHAGSHYTHAPGEVRHILARLAVCPVCGSAMKRTYKGDLRYPPRYVCSQALSGKAGACERVYVSVAAVERAVLAGAAALARGAPGADKELNAERGRLDAELSAVRTKAEGLGAQVLTAALDLDDSAPAVSPALLKAHAQLEARAFEIAGRLDALDAKAAAASTNVIRQRVGAMVDALADYDLLREKQAPATNAVLFETFSRVVVDYRDGTLTFHWRHGVPPSVLPCGEIKAAAP